jgi:hypothetical protein
MKKVPYIILMSLQVNPDGKDHKMNKMRKKKKKRINQVDFNAMKVLTVMFKV